MYTLLVLGTAVAFSSGFAFNDTTTPKPKTFQEELQADFINLGKKLAMEALGGAVEIGCRRGCPRLCQDQVGQFFCRFVCAPCGQVKRSISESTTPKGHLTPMPNKFSSYDINEDGVVSIKELTFVTGQGATEADVTMVFDMADTNGDKVLTPRELYEGPFVFEMDLSNNDYMYCKYMEKRMNRNSLQQPVN